MEPTAPDAAVPRSMDALYAAARACLLHHGRRLGGHTWDVEDILHDTVLVAQRKIDRFVPSPGVPPPRALQSWLLSIARRLADKRRHRRDESCSRLASHDETPDPAPDPEALAGEAERRALLAEILGGLRPERAEALLLHACGDQTASAIAEALGVNPHTIKSRILRGTRDLRAAVEKAGLGQR